MWSQKAEKYSRSHRNHILYLTFRWVHCLLDCGWKMLCLTGIKKQKSQLTLADTFTSDRLIPPCILLVVSAFISFLMFLTFNEKWIEICFDIQNRLKKKMFLCELFQAKHQTWLPLPQYFHSLGWRKFRKTEENLLSWNHLKMKISSTYKLNSY